MHLADLHWSISVSLTYEQNMLESPLHLRTKPLPQLSYHQVASHMGSDRRTYQLSRTYKFLLEIQPGIETHIAQQIPACKHHPAPSHRLRKLQRHPIDVHVLHLPSPHFRPNRVWRLWSHSIDCTVLVWSAKKDHNILLRNMNKWQSTWNTSAVQSISQFFALNGLQVNTLCLYQFFINGQQWYSFGK